MENLGIPFSALLAYTHSEAEHWHAWFAQHPAALDVPYSDKMKVLDLVGHIFQSELWFATRLSGEELSKSDFDYKSMDDLFAMHEKAHATMARYLESADEAEMQRVQALPFREGLEVSSRKLVSQSFLHAVHHWAQVATVLRQAGMPGEGPRDFILSHAMK